MTRPAALGLPPGLAAGQAADAQLFLQAIGNDASAARKALDSLAPQWRDSYTIIPIELMRLFVRDRPGEAPDPSSATGMARKRIFDFLRSRTKKRFGTTSRPGFAGPGRCPMSLILNTLRSRASPIRDSIRGWRSSFPKAYGQTSGSISWNRAEFASMAFRRS
ncbi:MAG: hypothetical protein FJW30_18370 [Acidobacteria bacterium]|nr:hypothetical protein [Acidobacteriota bacterium]